MTKHVTKDRTRPVSAATQQMLDEMRQDSPVASEDQLAAIRKLAAEWRDLELERDRLRERQSEIHERVEKIRFGDLLDSMNAAGVKTLSLEAVGNMPAFTVETSAYYHANIDKDWEPQRRERAFAWIRKHHDGMLKNTVTVQFGMKSGGQQKMLEAFLKKSKIGYVNEFGVPWNTLTAFVREQIEEHGRTPPLELLGATVGRVAKIKKEKK